MRHAVVVGVVAVLVLAAVIVPLFLFFKKDPIECYAPFDGSESCYSRDASSWYRWYGPKTDYSISTGLIESDAEEVKHPGCAPVMLYLFNRHSARYPDLEDLRKMSETLHKIRNWTMEAAEKGNVKMCARDLKKLQNWEPSYHFSDAAQAMRKGVTDVHRIATRFKKMFPSLLPSQYSPEFFKFGISNRERTNQSLHAFIEKIFDPSEMSKIQYPPADVELVSFHKNCEKNLWPNHTKPARELFHEPEAFRKSSITSRYVNNVKLRLGIQDKQLSYTDLRQIALDCAVSFTAYRESPWCAALSKQDLLVTEYDDDIYDFYKDAYGRPLNAKMGCPVLNELVNLFSDAAQRPHEAHLKSVLYFTHSRDYKKLLASFDLYHDEEPLRADDFCTQRVQNRRWRDANISPYSANIAFVLFKCGGAFKVFTLINEQPTRLPKCTYSNKHDFLCDMEEFASKHRFKNCDIPKICTPKAIYETWPDSHWEDK